jgi:hypothetical protein
MPEHTQVEKCMHVHPQMLDLGEKSNDDKHSSLIVRSSGDKGKKVLLH